MTTSRSEGLPSTRATAELQGPWESRSHPGPGEASLKPRPRNAPAPTPTGTAGCAQLPPAHSQALSPGSAAARCGVEDTGPARPLPRPRRAGTYAGEPCTSCQLRVRFCFRPSRAERPSFRLSSPQCLSLAASTWRRVTISSSTCRSTRGHGQRPCRGRATESCSSSWDGAAAAAAAPPTASAGPSSPQAQGSRRGCPSPHRPADDSARPARALPRDWAPRSGGRRPFSLGWV